MNDDYPTRPVSDEEEDLAAEILITWLQGDAQRHHRLVTYATSEFGCAAVIASTSALVAGMAGGKRDLMIATLRSIRAENQANRDKEMSGWR